MKTSKFLLTAKKFIDAPEKWTQGSDARTEDGIGVSARSIRAVCYCSVGALQKLHDPIDFYDDTNRHEMAAYKYLRIAMRNRNIAEFNDCHTHAEVMAAWDKAIQLAIDAGD